MKIRFIRECPSLMNQWKYKAGEVHQVKPPCYVKDGIYFLCCGHGTFMEYKIGLDVEVC